MTRGTLTVPLGLRDYDPLRDKSYELTALGPDVVDWLAYLDLAGRADRTRDQYERDLARGCLMYPSKAIAERTDVECLHVVSSFKPGERRTRKAAYDSFFTWARRQRRIETNPMELLPTISRKAQRWYDVFSEVEVDDLADLPVVDGALALLLLEAGLRKSEAVKLQVRRLKLDVSPPEVILLAAKGDKDRVMPMSARLAQAVNELLLLEQLAPLDHVWYTRPGGGPVSRSRPIGDGSFDRWWRRCLAGAGVRYRNPHMTRHTFATRWLRRGGRLETLSVAMGHRSIKTTYDLYGHLDTRDVAADLERIEDVVVS
jgi:integrase